MKSEELKSILRKQFPSLRKRFPWSDDPITCRDGEYPFISKYIYEKCCNSAWSRIKEAGIEYNESFPDCDDFLDIFIGLFKIEWFKLIKNGDIPLKTSPSLAGCEGCNPQGEMHAFAVFKSDLIYISDYGNTLDPVGYKPVRAKF